MKCQITSSTTHGVLISKEISHKSYKEICKGEKKKVNLGYNNVIIPYVFKYIYGQHSQLSRDWEVLYKFFAIHNIEPSWLDCGMSWGWYNEKLGEWTGCMGKV